MVGAGTQGRDGNACWGAGFVMGPNTLEGRDVRRGRGRCLEPTLAARLGSAGRALITRGVS